MGENLTTTTMEPVNTTAFEEAITEANSEHVLVGEAIREGLAHAIVAGAALTKAKEEFSGFSWGKWLREACESGVLGFHRDTANWYLRIYQYRNELTAASVMSANEANAFLRDNRLFTRKILGPEEVDEMLARVNAGESMDAVAEDFGVTRNAIQWHRKSPASKQKVLEYNRERQRKKREAKRHERVRRTLKAGTAGANLYATSERMQDVLGQAEREATSPAQRAAYQEAGEHYRKMRDAIVRASLGG